MKAEELGPIIDGGAFCVCEEPLSGEGEGLLGGFSEVFDLVGGDGCIPERHHGGFHVDALFIFHP